MFTACIHVWLICLMNTNRKTGWQNRTRVSTIGYENVTTLFTFFAEVLSLQRAAHSTTGRREEIFKCQKQFRSHAILVHSPQMCPAVLQCFFRLLRDAEHFPCRLFRYCAANNVMYGLHYIFFNGNAYVKFLIVYGEDTFKLDLFLCVSSSKS